MGRWLRLSGIDKADPIDYETNLQLVEVDERTAAEKTSSVRLAFLNDAKKALNFQRCIGEFLVPRFYEDLLPLIIHTGKLKVLY